MQDELYEEQVIETDPKVKDNILKQFMNEYKSNIKCNKYN